MYTSKYLLIGVEQSKNDNKYHTRYIFLKIAERLRINTIYFFEQWPKSGTPGSPMAKTRFPRQPYSPGAIFLANPRPDPTLAEFQTGLTDSGYSSAPIFYPISIRPTRLWPGYLYALYIFKSEKIRQLKNYLVLRIFLSRVSNMTR